MSSAGKLLIASALAAVFATACTSTQIAPVSDNSTTGTIKSGPASVPAAPAASSSGAQVVLLSSPEVPLCRPRLLPHPGTPTP